MMVRQEEKLQNIYDLYKNFDYMVRQRNLKITILGSTGVGKTSFVKSYFIDLAMNEVPRDLKKENKVDLIYSELKYGFDYGSTTTLGYNQFDVMLLQTKFNKFYVEPLKKDALTKYFDNDLIERAYFLSIFDVGGQTRFNFIWEICIEGADAYVLMADGTNISSIEFLNSIALKIHKEEQKRKTRLPYVIFINKADLKEKGIFIDKITAKPYLQQASKDREIDLILHETTIFKKETFDLGIRWLLEQVPGKHVVFY